MTGDSPVLDRPALRAALSDMPIDPPEGETCFEAALAARQRWNLGFAERVTDEYRRFLYLAATAGFEVTPSRSVDEAWHLHLTLPHYREIMCGRILGQPLDHLPGTGTPEDDARCARQYEQTLALYERTFGEPAPADIWPRPTAPEAPDLRWWHGRESQIAATLVMVPTGLVALAIGINELGYLLITIAVFAGMTMLWETRTGRRSKDSADWELDVAGGGCGASCGGGCGGGCGG